MIPSSNKYIAGSLVAALLVASQAVGQTQPHGTAAIARSASHLATIPIADPPVGAGTPEYRIGPEDVLDIVVWGNVDLTRNGVPVRPDGRISMAIVNDVQAAGLTPMELRNLISKKLEPKFTDQEVSVTVREVNSLRISIVGLVRNPSRVLLRSQLTVIDAIAMAGGFVDFAKRDKIYVLRNGNRLPFNYDRFVNEPGGQENFILQAGDTIVIP
jgi:polysaccharide export outer membrane protein